MKMKKIHAALLVASLAVPTACKDFLDVNSNPNAPETVSPVLYLPPMEHWFVMSPQWDGRFISRYTQMWKLTNGQTSLSSWDRMGYDPGSDNGGQQWRDVYWTLGQNLQDMMSKAEAEQRWDLLGVGQILRAWGWLVTTDMHGEIVVKEAFDPTRFSFDYDSQEYAYGEIQRLLNEAIKNLQRADGAVDATYLAKGDNIYNGDRAKWLKYAYGMLGMTLNHYSNKASYKPADVIAAIDKSFTSNADDALLAFPAAQPNDDRNFFGPTRGNINSYRQTQFTVNMMNGTDFGGTVDPRMSRMLAPSPDGQYRGVDVDVAGYGALTATQQPMNFFGYPGVQGAGLPSRYIFDDKTKFPNMTYAQLQFVKAEAAFRSGDKATALQAYKNGISAHIDFVNARNSEISSQSATPISAAEKAAFLADPNIVPSASGLTLTQIMLQKYIAQWSWGFNEAWMDMRRYRYTDIDPATGDQVFKGFSPPVNLYPDNAGKLVWRIRPRYNSEYIWNIPGLSAIGGLAADYHTKPTWIVTP